MRCARRPSPTSSTVCELASRCDSTIARHPRSADAAPGHARQPQPEIVFHLAAQPLVRARYREPRRDLRHQRHGHGPPARGRARTPPACAPSSSSPPTSATRTANGPGATARTKPLGGHDPYSSSKACARARHRRAIATPSWTHAGVAVWPPRAPATSSAAATGPRTAWSRTSCAPGRRRSRSTIRTPHAIRPWQHVLEPLSGYLLLAERLYAQATGLCRSLELRPGRRAMPGRCSGSSNACAAQAPRRSLAMRHAHAGPHEAG